MAQGKLDARYTASLSGIPVGRGAWVIDVTDRHFSAVASGATAGLLRFFASGEGTGAARGSMAKGRPVGQVFSSTLVLDKKAQDVRLALAEGGIREFEVSPPLRPHSQRIPVTAADRRNVLDPMSAALFAVPGNGDMISPDACPRYVPVFDGRMRYDLSLSYKRIETVRAEKGYEGPAVVCGVNFTPIAGHIAGRKAIKYLTEQRDMEAWLVPIAGTRIVVPFRISVPTPVGQAALEATQFLTEPVATRASSATQ